MATPEEAVRTLAGRVPIALLPVRLETRFFGPSQLVVRVFPDQQHIDSHDPALTSDEEEGGRWYWSQRWAGVDADTLFAALRQRFEDARAAYVIRATRPENLGAGGAIPPAPPIHPQVARREPGWSRAPQAALLPHQYCVLGFRVGADGTPQEVFRKWSSAVPPRLAVGPSPSLQAPQERGGLPKDPEIGWLHDPSRAAEAGMLLIIDEPSLAGNVDRLLVVGVDTVRTPEQAAQELAALFAAQRDAGSLGFVTHGTPTNNTGTDRSGLDTSVAAPAASPSTKDKFSAGTRLAAALGLPEQTFDDVPGAADRDHAWHSALADVLWSATAGFYVHDMIDPAADPTREVDALRDFAVEHLFACGPLPTIRTAKVPYGVLPVVAAARLAPHRAASQAVHRVASALRRMVRPAIDEVPRLQLAGTPQNLDDVLLALLCRTPVPWSFRFRHLTGPIQRRYMSVNWDRLAAFQADWTGTLFSQLGHHELTRLQELTLDGRDHPLPVPLVRKEGDSSPTHYLREIADLMITAGGLAALNVREDSETLLEALAAYSAVLEMTRAGLDTVRDGLDRIDPGATAAHAVLLRGKLSLPQTVRVESTTAAPALDFTTHRQVAKAVVPQLDPVRPVGDLVAEALRVRVPTGADPHRFAARCRSALLALAEAPPDRLEWAVRGHLDLFASRLDAWFTALAHERLTEHRAGAPTGVHIGCWGWVEGLREDTGAGAESHGYVHTPSLAHATSTALLRNGRLANRGAEGEVFDLQITAARVRQAKNILEGVATGQRLAALLGYRIERRLREAGLPMMRYQLPLREVAPLRGPRDRPDEPVETLAAQDVVDGVTLLDRWRTDRAGVLAALAARAAVPPDDAAKLGAVLDDVASVYDAVSDVLVAEAVHQAAQGNLERAGAALAAHDRQAAVGELDFVATPRSGHTVAHRAGVLLQETAYPPNWPRDARSLAESGLDSWMAAVLGDAAMWRFSGRLTRPGQQPVELAPLSVADLGLSALSVVIGASRSSAGHPTELQSRVVLAFTQRLGAAPDEDTQLEVLPHGPDGPATPGGLALLETLAGWLTSIAGAPPMTPADLMAASDLGPVNAEAGTYDVEEIASRVVAVQGAQARAIAALSSAVTDMATDPGADSATEPTVVLGSSAEPTVVLGSGAEPTVVLGSAEPTVILGGPGGPSAPLPQAGPLARALLAAAIFDGPDALPRVPANHPEAATLLTAQATAVLTRLTALQTKAAELSRQPLTGDEPGKAIERHREVLHLLLGNGQPVLPRWTLAQPAPIAAALADRVGLLAGDPTAPVVWLHRSALVRERLDPLAATLLHLEAAGADMAEQLAVIQQPARPNTPWIALPLGPDGPPEHGAAAAVLHTLRPVDPAMPMAGVLVDSWTETIPSTVDTTAVAFHFDAPGARAPQAMLLAVHPAHDPASWDFGLLVETVMEAVQLARLRTVSAAELSPLGSFLPALYLPDDYTHDVASVPLWQLLSQARLRAGTALAAADVLGKGE